MPASKARIQANSRYDVKAYKQLRARFRKPERLDELVKVAARRKNISDAAYIVAAVRAALDADGITLDDLPPAAQDEKQPDEE